MDIIEKSVVKGEERMKSNRSLIKALAMITQIGLSMLTPIFLCVFGGRWLDETFQTKYWLIILLILGVLAAFRNVFYLTKSFYAKDKEREDAELQYFESLKNHSKKK